jgi:hypothetical protein
MRVEGEENRGVKTMQGFWTAFWAIVPPIALLILAFVQFFRRDFSERLSEEHRS